MRKTWMIFALVAGLMSANANLKAQDTGICYPNPCQGLFSPPPATLNLGVILVQFSDWATNTDARGDRCHAHRQDNHYSYQELSQPMLNFCNHRKNVRAFSQNICL